MKSLSDHASKVNNCLNEINKDIQKNNFKGGRTDYKDKMKDIAISNYCSKYGLKIGNIKMIFEARFEHEKKKVVLFNNF
jgi:hypothetical protein